MMYGHIETTRERIEHLIKLRDLQNTRPENHYGFITFIPWPFQDEGTVLRREQGIRSQLQRVGLFTDDCLKPNNIKQYKEHPGINTYCRQGDRDVIASCRRQ